MSKRLFFLNKHPGCLIDHLWYIPLKEKKSKQTEKTKLKELLNQRSHLQIDNTKQIFTN